MIEQSADLGVGQVIAEYMAAWNEHDVHALVELFTDDASFVNVNGSWLEDRVQLQASTQIIHSSIFKDSTVEIRPGKIRMVRSDVAVVQATWQLRGDSRRSAPRDYVMTLVLRKQDVGWKILAAQNGSTEDRSTTGFANLRASDVAALPARETINEPTDHWKRVHATIEAFDQAWNDRNRVSMAQVFAPDADFVDTAAQWVQRRELIASHMIDVELPRLGNRTRTSGIEKHTPLYPDLVVAFVRWNLHGSDPSSVFRQGMGLRVLEDKGVGWQIVAAEDTLIRASG